jgi:hypothetical protein
LGSSVCEWAPCFGLSPSIPCRLPLPAQRPYPLGRTSVALAEGGPEFQDIVCGTDERPLAVHLPHSAQQELSIAAALFDLVSADAIRPHITELRSPLHTESQCPFTAHHDGGGTDAAKGGLHDDSGIGATWALSL